MEGLVWLVCFVLFFAEANHIYSSNRKNPLNKTLSLVLLNFGLNCLTDSIRMMFGAINYSFYEMASVLWLFELFFSYSAFYFLYLSVLIIVFSSFSIRKPLARIIEIIILVIFYFLAITHSSIILLDKSGNTINPLYADYANNFYYPSENISDPVFVKSQMFPTISWVVLTLILIYFAFKQHDKLLKRKCFLLSFGLIIYSFNIFFSLFILRKIISESNVLFSVIKLSINVFSGWVIQHSQNIK